MNKAQPLAHPRRLLSPEQEAKAQAMIGTSGAGRDEDWLEDLTAEQAREVDDIVFRCGVCDWWCAAEECNETGSDWVCDGECLRDGL
jgi:hypothetical protein